MVITVFPICIEKRNAVVSFWKHLEKTFDIFEIAAIGGRVLKTQEMSIVNRIHRYRRDLAQSYASRLNTLAGICFGESFRKPFDVTRIERSRIVASERTGRKRPSIIISE